MWETPWSAAIMATNRPAAVVCGDTATNRPAVVVCGDHGDEPWSQWPSSMVAKAQSLSQAFRFDLSAAKA